MAKHAEALWSSVKDATYISPQSILSTESESLGGMSFQDSDIMTQAFVLLQEVIRQYADFISLIIGDSDIHVFISSLNQYKGFDDIPLEIKQRLHAVGHILYTCAKPSIEVCSKVFEVFFPLLMDGLGLPAPKSSENSYVDDDWYPPAKFNFGALYLCIQLLEASRYLTLSLDNCTMYPDFSHQTWCAMLSKFSKSLVKAFISLLRSNVADYEQSAYVYFGGHYFSFSQFTSEIC